jgi:hypothetical protein
LDSFLRDAHMRGVGRQKERFLFGVVEWMTIKMWPGKLKRSTLDHRKSSLAKRGISVTCFIIQLNL